MSEVLEAFKSRGVNTLQDFPVFPVIEGEALEADPFGRSEADIFSGHESKQPGGRKNGLAHIESPPPARYRDPFSFPDRQIVAVDQREIRLIDPHAPFLQIEQGRYPQILGGG